MGTIQFLLLFVRASVCISFYFHLVPILRACTMPTKGPDLKNCSLLCIQWSTDMDRSLQRLFSIQNPNFGPTWLFIRQKPLLPSLIVWVKILVLTFRKREPNSKRHHQASTKHAMAHPTPITACHTHMHRHGNFLISYIIISFDY